jgi:hypothetical protein
MAQYTQRESLPEFVRAGGFVVESAEDFKAIPDEAFDAYVRQHTEFADWREMHVAAVRVWARRQLLK